MRVCGITKRIKVLGVYATGNRLYGVSLIHGYYKKVFTVLPEKKMECFECKWKMNFSIVIIIGISMK